MVDDNTRLPLRAHVNGRRPGYGRRAVVHCWPLVGLLVLGLVGLAACTGTAPSRPRSAASASLASLTPSVAATSSATGTPSVPATIRPSAPQPSSAPPAPATPEAVVLAYFQAINDHDYARAWELGGRNFGQSYDTFVQGFADTVHDTVTVTRTDGGAVTVELLAVHTDGSMHRYAGRYTVTVGTITSANIHEVTGTPGAPGGSACGAPSNPYGYNFCGNGQVIYSPPADFCSLFTCVGNFVEGRGYVVQCVDGKFSKSGGRPGACSGHGGVGRRLYGPS